MQKLKKRIQGLTMYEVILVMGITAILAAVGTINFVGFKRAQDLQLTRNEIVSVLRNAQDRSITQVEETSWGVRVENPTSDRGVFELFRGATYNPANVIARHTLRSGIEFTEPAPGTSDDITFTGITGEVGSQKTIQLRIVNNPLSSSTITMYQNGRIE